MSNLVRPVVNGLIVLFLAAVPARYVWALGQESFGPAGEHIGRSSDWPKGVENLLRHPSRVYWRWINGHDQAYYDGDVKAVNELLELYSRVEQASHPVVVRAGRSSARSFQGKLTPYAVSFEVPSGVYLHHVRQYATTGLYSEAPRLFVHVNETLAEHLEELKIPANVTLQTLAYPIEDALAQTGVADRSLRGRAIMLLGEAGDSSPAVIDALKQAADDEDQYIRDTAQRALEQIEQANDSSGESLRQKVAAFLDGHQQRLRIPAPTELLELLRGIDDRYDEGFTARGTMIVPTLSGPGRLVAWTLTMGRGRLVLDQRPVQDDDHPPAEGPLEYTIFVGSETMATIRSERLWVDGELIDSKPHISFEPVGSTYDLLIGRFLWPLGRGFTRRIDRITQVSAEADGTLSVTAESDENALNLRWEMQIDPGADYLVRFARAFRRQGVVPSYIVDNAGILAAADRSTAHTARWAEGPLARPISIAVTTVSAQPDDELIRRTEEQINQQNVRDQR